MSTRTTTSATRSISCSSTTTRSRTRARSVRRAAAHRSPTRSAPSSSGCASWLELSPRDHLLEIGCGWGGMAIHAARTRGCRVTAITVSREQHELASARVAAAGLADRVDDRVSRLPRRSTGTFDKIVSIEMLEQVGYEYLPRYFATCARVLAPGGRLAVQTITMPDDRFDAYRRRVDWMQTYIFPGTLIPSLAAIRAACAPLAVRAATTSARATRRRSRVARALRRRTARGPRARLRHAVHPNVAAVPRVQRGGVRGAHARRSSAAVRALTRAEQSIMPDARAPRAR